MQQLIIASNNPGKIREITQMIDGIELLSLRDIGFSDDIPEPFQSFEENAFAKASAVHRYSGRNVFADDSGLCVNALGGAPGVDSAHYSGERDDEKNLQLVLEKLKGTEDKSAFYKAVICLTWDEQIYYFEGVCSGRIIDEKRGTEGFGYDPIFVPGGYTETFGELSLSVKNQISHRAIAVKQMIDFLKEKLRTGNPA